MTTRLPYKTTFEPERVIQPIFTGGAVALDNGARILATTLGEDAVLTDLKTGRQYAKIQGDDEPISTLTCMPSLPLPPATTPGIAMTDTNPLQ